MALALLALLRASEYLLLALGFALVFGAGRVLNLAHGSVFLVSAYAADVAARTAGQAAGGVAGLTAAVGAGAVLSVALYDGLLRRTRADPLRTLLVCLAINFAVTESLRALAGSHAVAVPLLVEGSVAVGEVRIASHRLIVLPVAAVVVASLWHLLHRTAWGRHLRAVAEDPEAATLLGLDPGRLLRACFLIAGVLVGLAAGLLAPSAQIGPGDWVSPLLRSFSVVVLGGAGSLGGAMLAAGGLAAAEVATTAFVSEGASEFVALAAIACGLALRPGRMWTHVR